MKKISILLLGSLIFSSTILAKTKRNIHCDLHEMHSDNKHTEPIKSAFTGRFCSSLSTGSRELHQGRVKINKNWDLIIQQQSKKLSMKMVSYDETLTTNRFYLNGDLHFEMITDEVGVFCEITSEPCLDTIAKVQARKKSLARSQKQTLKVPTLESKLFTTSDQAINANKLIGK